ncbi:YjbH domain-containing protein [Alisedimentitalea sp. MJ-SS2]|uniref:YjbH domain-containing protein n=1 Tax=Aliisedimentitalea sp. MJ-SS2 TaxID=3049795 RepID=UPI00290B721E|nr:YjbH domain-containing protein [Alisedimentitalea sp. MJ-SS2]MDU8929614.1 YjbH domain-containing protein [Alisedimentitalea sp. MJ-SS2]
MRMRFTAAVIGASILGAGAVGAEPTLSYSKNMYGLPGGLIDMPTAEVAPDGELSTTLSHFGGTTKTTLTFQLLPRLTGAFRYSALKNYRPGRFGPTPYPNSSYYDRSFDLKYQVLKEGTYRPAVAIGMRDFIGTGLYSAEYVVATKSIGSRLRVTGGVGWGRMGSFNSFATTGTRPGIGIIGAGGNLRTDRWFKGPMSAFGGVSYQVNDRLSFKAEYSTDNYSEERGAIVGGPVQDAGANMFTRKSPWNFGADYKISPRIALGASYMYGSTFGLKLTLATDLKGAAVPGGSEAAPLPVAVRPRNSASDLGWTDLPGKPAMVQSDVANALAKEGIMLEGMKLDGRSVRVVMRNTRYDIESQAVGRTARALTRNLPASVEEFTVVQTYQGMPTGAVTLKRSDVEALENAPAHDILQRAVFSSGAGAWDGVAPVDGAYPRLSWSLGPYGKLGVFDPDNPVKLDVGLKLSADYHFAPGWVVSGAASVKLTGNLDAAPSGRSGAGVGTLPAVRSDGRLYAAGNDPKIEHLTIAKYGRLGPDWYTRVTVGYLESMYAGASGEVLWKPASSRLAFGAELNYVRPREYSMGLGLKTRHSFITDPATGITSYAGLIPEWNGHVSAYYDFGNGFHGEMNVGRYLAGDWGATVAVDREFNNGWRVGAYVTKTNVSAAAFGEGSFDKGIRITIPLSSSIGSATRKKNKIVLQSLSRNGGARLNVNGRLYEAVRDAHHPEMAKTWGRFWR